MRALVLASILVGMLAGCGDDPPKQYATYQDCFDDKFHDDMKPIVESIVTCCTDHEIGGMKGPVCGDVDADCINYLTANLKQTDADITVTTEACRVYVSEKAK